MKPLDLQATIVAHLRMSGAPVTGRDLAARFLRIRNADEDTCHRLLAPILTPVAGVRHQPGAGWVFAGPPETAGSPRDAPAGAGPAVGSIARGEELYDFVALAADGAGPGGSGALRSLAFVPVLGGEELQEEHLPSSGLDGIGPPDPYDADGEAGEALAEAASPGRFTRARPGLTTVDLQALVEAVGDLPIVAHRVAREVDPIRRTAHEAGLSFHPRVISAARLGHLLLGLKANHAATDLAAALGAEAKGPDDCRGRVKLVARSFLGIIPLLKRRGIATLDALLEFQDMPAAPVDLSGRGFTAADLKALPSGPGVYRFIDGDGQVIYVGKAKNLRSRVGSYFTPSARGTAKGQAILVQAHRIAYETTASELEAALLEAALLAEHRPRLNRQFEIHERPAPYGPRLNLVVVLKDSGAPAAACTLHFLRGGFYLRRLSGLTAGVSGPSAAVPGRDPWQEVAATLSAAYFQGNDSPDAGPGADLDWQLVGSFLRRFRDEVNVLDIDESEDIRSAVDRLRVLVEATLSAHGRTLAR